MKRILIFAALCASFGLAQAMDSFSAPTVSERLESAHKALKAKDYDRAMKELQAAAKDEPRNADVQNLIGYTYRVRANPDLPKSFEHYNLALKYNPNHKGTMEYMGEAYLMDKKPEEAEKMLVRLEGACGNKTCPEYQELFKAIADYKTSAK
jgi:tetratricopeptide (TPR) repeat protein